MTASRETRLAVTLVVVIEAMLLGTLAVLGGLVHLRAGSWAAVVAPCPWWMVTMAGAIVTTIAALVPPRVGALLLLGPFVGGTVVCAWLGGHGAPRANDWAATALIFSAVLTVLALLGAWRLWVGGVAWRPHVWLTATGWLCAGAVLYA